MKAIFELSLGVSYDKALELVHLFVVFPSAMNGT